MPTEESKFILPTAERTIYILRGELEYLTYWYRRRRWECIDSTRRLEFLSIIPMDQIEVEVKRLGWRWKWCLPSDEKIYQRSLEYQRKYGGEF